MEELKKRITVSPEKAALRQSCCYLRVSIYRELAERERWRVKAEKCTTTISDMPRADTVENAREQAMIEMVECDRRAGEMIRQLAELRERAIQYAAFAGDNDTAFLALFEL